MKSREYWAERFIQLEDKSHALATEGIDEILDIYEKATFDINRDIQAWYMRIAENNNISYSQARKLLTKGELKEFKWTVEEYIKYGQENAINQAWIKELENASAKLHISKLEALKLQTRNTIEVLADKKIKSTRKTLRGIYERNYYHGAYEIQKGFNLGWDLQTIDTNRVEKILTKPWAADEINFSERIWNDKNKLINNLHKELSQSIIRGKSPTEAIKNISKIMGTSKSSTARLVYTESAYISSASQKDCFNDLGVEKYEIVATLDSKTSEICRDLDGETFEMKVYEPGVTANPFHPYCRTCTAPYFDDNYTERVVGGGSDGYYIPGNISYKEWLDRFVK